MQHRNTGDNILLAHEHVKGYHRSGISHCCSTDLMKAFDLVAWRLVLHVLRAIEVLVLFVQWIAACITGATYSININGAWKVALWR